MPSSPPLSEYWLPALNDLQGHPALRSQRNSNTAPVWCLSGIPVGVACTAPAGYGMMWYYVLEAPVRDSRSRVRGGLRGGRGRGILWTWGGAASPRRQTEAAHGDRAQHTGQGGAARHPRTRTGPHRHQRHPTRASNRRREKRPTGARRQGGNKPRHQEPERTGGGHNPPTPPTQSAAPLTRLTGTTRH